MNPPRMIDVYRDATRTVEHELDTRLEPLKGKAPFDGVLYRNGPGRQELFGIPYGHPFDGDGMISRFEFSRGEVRYRNRYVRTRELAAEEKAGKPLFRSFGTNLPGGLLGNLFRLNFKNAANTSVIPHGGKLLALWEGGLPHSIDPVTLETLERYDYRGKLQNRNTFIDRTLAPELPFSAHPKFADGEMYNFGMAVGVKPRLMLYRVASDGTMESPVSIRLDQLSFVHDFVLTENHLVFFLPAVAFDIPRTLAGFSTPVDSLQMLPRPTKILVVRRKDFGVAQELYCDPGFVFHFVNGYEEDGRFVIDGFQLPELPDGDATRDIVEGRDRDFPRATLVRTEFSLNDARAGQTEMFNVPGELPQIDPRFASQRHRYVFAATTPKERSDPFLTGVGRFDLETGTETVRSFGRDLIGEPVFVPGGEGEGDGWLLTVAHSAEHGRAELRVLDATNLEDVAHYAVPHSVPPGFHGCFVPADAKQ